MVGYCSCRQGDCGIVLKRKPKKRYLSVLYTGKDVESFDALSRRCAELFGQVTLEKAGMRLLRSYPNVMIIRFRLSQLHAVLLSVALVNPPMVTLDLSGNVGRLGKRLDTGAVLEV